jgi:hypothetical protein
MGFLVLWLVMGAVVGVIAQSKGQSFLAWAAYGFVLWPVALVHILVTKPAPAPGERKCPSCAEIVQADAVRCKHCQADLTPPPAQQSLSDAQAG